MYRSLGNFFDDLANMQLRPPKFLRTLFTVIANFFWGRVVIETKPNLRVVSWNQQITDDPYEAVQFREVELSNCEFGCKIYQHTGTGERVLAHHSVYGCRK